MPLPTLPTALAAAIAFAALTPTAHAADAAAKFRSETRVGMTEAEFKTANTQLFAQGMRLVDITVAQAKGKPVIGAIWWWNEGMAAPSTERTSRLLDQIRLKQSEQDLRALGEKLGPQGSQLEVIDSYSVDGKTWFATAFSPPGEAPLQPVGTFLTNEQVGGMRGEAQANGFELLRLDAYIDAGELRFLPVFARHANDEIEVVGAENEVGLQAQAAGRTLRDMAPLSVSMLENGARGNVSYVASFGHDTGRELLLRLGPEEFRKELAGKLGDGGQVVDLDSYAYDDGVRYSAVIAPDRKKVNTDAYKHMGDNLEKLIKK